MDLNYHHLRYFWAVARTGNLTRASAELHLAPQTVSTQIKLLEAALGEALFQRSGRGLALTEAGRVAFRYADEIFAVGHELTEVLGGRSVESATRLLVGVADVLPKLVAYHLIQPALDMDAPVRVVCSEAAPEELLAELAIHRLDVVLSDAPVPPTVNVRAHNHLLGECGVTFMASRSLATRYRRGFPGSLDNAPILLPFDGTVLRRALEQWFVAHDIHPVVVGEFGDSGLLKAFGQAGAGVFPVPSVIATEVARQQHAVPIGTADGVTERFYAISLERTIRQPAVAAICAAARSDFFSAA